MTAASGGVRRGASDKTPCYERLRARLLEVEARRTPLAAASAVVLVRQGMSAWMQLEDDQRPEPRTDHDRARDHTAPCPPAAEHSELLAVLTGLVFHVCSQKDSA
jgi:hypothetical protein